MSTSSELWLYHSLASLSRLNYRAKIMLMAFIGTHIPLLALIGYFVLTTSTEWRYTLWVLGVTVGATLLGTGVTLFVLNHLLRPILLTSQGLRRYMTAGVLPTLPTHYTDEAGVLMADTAFALHKLDRTIEQLAHYDAVTGLPNRGQFLRQAGLRIAEANRGGGAVAVAAIRIQNLTQLTATFGQAMADTVLRTVAQRLEAAVGHRHLVARTDGDIFAVLLDGLKAPEQVAAALTELSEVMSGKRAEGGAEVMLKTRAGVSLYPSDGRDPEALLNNAFTALAVASGW